MLGVIVGTACLIGLIKVIRHGHHGRWHHRYGGCGPHGACGPADCGPGGSWRGPFGGGRYPRGFDMGGDGTPGGYDDGGPMMLRGLFSSLGTTPGQERVVVDALRELKGAVKKAAEERAKSAKQVAEALRGDDFKTEHMGEAFVHLDAGAEAVRDAGFSALAKIHAVLDQGQRRILADVIARGGATLERLAEQV